MPASTARPSFVRHLPVQYRYVKHLLSLELASFVDVTSKVSQEQELVGSFLLALIDIQRAVAIGVAVAVVKVW